MPPRANGNSLGMAVIANDAAVAVLSVPSPSLPPFLPPSLSLCLNHFDARIVFCGKSYLLLRSLSAYS